jgi:hypothetical protein
MSNILGGLYSFGDSLKRNVKDFARSPDGYLAQTADELRRRMRTEPEKVVMDAANLGPLGSLAGVIKQKGGNWLSGSVEDALRGLRREGLSLEDIALAQSRIDEALAGNAGVVSPEYVARANERLSGERGKHALNSWIDQKLAKYVKNVMATPEDPIRLLADKWSEEKAVMVAQAQAKLSGLNAKTQKLMEARGVPEEYLTRHRQDVLNAEKELALIEARGGLHYTPEPGPSMMARRVRSDAKMPLEGVGVSDLARDWESASDSMLRVFTPLDIASRVTSIGNSPLMERALKSKEWVTKLPKNTPIYDARPGVMDAETGFPHLIDELSNALNPQSGLPQHLLIDPNDLSKINIPQAVRRVDEINAYRATQKAEADALRANNAATVLHKEYPDDPRGMRWVELKAPEPSGNPADAWNGNSPDVLLKDALKYEGDTMQHCVGGYCDDVASGRSRIYSLRDAKGQPHVTIEMRPPQGFAGKKSREEYEAWLRTHATPHGEKEIQEALMELDKGGAWDPSILQIKGKQNRKPNDEYLPFVQDFIRNGKWSDVRDLENAGMQRAQDYLSRDQIEHLGLKGGEVDTIEGFNQLLDSLGTPDFASGGKVDGRTGGTRIRNAEES